jgi:ATP-dependent DNA helicase RecG
LNYEAYELQPVTGINANGVGGGAEVPNNGISITLTEGRNAKIIIRAIKANSHVTIVELCRKTRLSTSGVYKTIAALKTAGMIRRVGPTKGGCWEVIG